MKILRLQLKNYRNIKECVFVPSDGVTVLCGGNGQGKTNLLEAVYFFCGGKSFRPGGDKDFIMRGEDCAKLSLFYESGGIEKSAEIILKRDGRKEIFSGGAKIKSRSELVGGFTAVLFAPEHLELVKSGPSERRRFLDFAISGIRPRYMSALAVLTKVAAQKNALLKTTCGAETLSVWNEKMAGAAAAVSVMRTEYVKTLEIAAGKYLESLSGGREKIGLALKRAAGFSEDFSEKEAFDFYLDLFESKAEQEIAAGMCLYGPQRDDLEIFVGDLPAKIYCSQGQQRSVILALKLAEGDISAECFGEPPVFLLDDIMSELDESRQKYIAEQTEGRQVLITACSGTEKYKKAKKYDVCAGEYRQLTIDN